MTMIVALLGVLALLASLSLSVALAQGQPPFRVVGTAEVDGKQAAEGTTVVAMIDGEKVGEGMVDAMGMFSVDIEGDEGATLTFKLIMGEGESAMVYMAETMEDVMVGMPGDLIRVDLMAFSDGVLPLTIRPAVAVPGQGIIIQGSGFVAGDRITSVSIGNQTAYVDATATTAGDILITVDVPSDPGGPGIGFGKKTVLVTAAGSGRTAKGSIEIPEPAITLDPVKSRRGTTVNVSGSGFPAGDLVQVKYDHNGTFVTVGAGSAGASGAVSIDFTVPSYARIGSTHNIEATSVGVYAPVTALSNHTVPAAMVTLSSDTVSSGEYITISGRNFPAFATVAVMEIGGVDVRPVPAPATSIDGDFESTVLVPLLVAGTHTVSIRVSLTTVTTSLEIDSSVPVPPPHETPDATVTLSSDTISSGKAITITGRNFPAFVTVAVITIGGIDVRPVPAPATSIDGYFESLVLVPQLEPGFQTIWVRVGQTTATTFLEIVPQANEEMPATEVTLSSDTISSGKTITIIGRNFPAFATVAVMEIGGVDVRPVPAPVTSVDGDFESTVLVPEFEPGVYTVWARVGQTTAITFVGIVPQANETPAAMLTLSSDTISSGETITITGRNFPVLTTVAVMEIGGVDVRPVPAPHSSIDGDFESTVLVPVLELRLQMVKVRVGQTTAITFLKIVPATSLPQADEHSASRSFSSTRVAPGAEITVNIALSEYGRGGTVVEILPEGFTFVPGSVEWTGGVGFVSPSGNQVRIVLAVSGTTNVTYKVTAPPEAGGPFTFTGEFTNFDNESVDIGGDSTVTVAADAGTPASYDFNGNGIIELPELFHAIDDYFAGVISLTTLFDIIDFYFSGDRVD